MEEQKPKYTSPYDLDGRIPLRQAIPLGLQHVLAMFVGNLSPLLIILATCGLTVDAGFNDLRVTLLQNAMVVAGLITFVQLYPIGPIGGKLPIVMGTSSGFIGINNSIALSTMAGIAAGRITTDANAGIFAYDDSPMRRFVLGTRSHNCALVDDLEQNRRGRYSWRDEPMDAYAGMKWSFSKTVDSVEGVG